MSLALVWIAMPTLSVAFSRIDSEKVFLRQFMAKA